MGTLERFNLRWDGFEANTKAVLRQLKEESEFFDVTLVGSDGKQVQANKVILAGGSSFFHKILKQNPHPHPLIYLTGVSYQNLLSVLDFLYTGEASIVQKDLNVFLDIAEDLKVKGLTAVGIQTNSFPFSPVPLQSQGAADKPSHSPKVSYPHNAATSASLQGLFATEECVQSPRRSHPHSALSASHEDHVATEEHGPSPGALCAHSSVTTTPASLQGKVAAEECVQSPRRSHPHSAISASREDHVATEEPGLSPGASCAHSSVTTTPAPLQSKVAAEECVQSPRRSHPHIAMSASREDHVATVESDLSPGASCAHSSVTTTPAPLQGQLATEDCVQSPRRSHLHSAISASREDHVATEEPGLSPRASCAHSLVTTTPASIQGKVAAEECVLSRKRSHPHSAMPASREGQVATEEPTTTFRDSLFPNVASSDLSNTVTEATSKEDNDDTYKVKVEFEDCDAAYYNVSYGINDDGEHCIKHVSISGLEDNTENISSKVSKSNISVSKVSGGNTRKRQNFENSLEQSEDYQDEGMGLCSEQEVKPKKKLIDSRSNVGITEAINCLENNRCKRDDKSKIIPRGSENDNNELNKENSLRRLDKGDMFDCNMVVTEAADSGFINEQSTYDCGERSEENEDDNDNVIPEGELDLVEEKCFYCIKTFSKSSELRKHKMMHIGEKQFQCLVCYKVFPALVKLTVHEKNHADKKNFQCLVCFKRFSQSGALSTHKRIHTGEKPYQCSQCFKRFTQSSTLKAHEMTHTGEKPHQCLHCSKRFTRARTLQDHMMIHTGKKRYQCLQCSKKFSRPYRLQEHKNTHTGEKPYQCLQCSKRFSMARNFNRHKKIHNGKKA